MSHTNHQFKLQILKDTSGGAKTNTTLKVFPWLHY